MGRGVRRKWAEIWAWLQNSRGKPEGCDTSGNLVRSGRNQLEIIGNQLEITEIWLEIRNQDPVEIRKSARNQREITRNPRETPPFCLSMRSRPFAHAHLRNPREIRVTRREISWKSVGNQLEITAKAGNQLEITEIRKSRTPVSYPSGKPKPLSLSVFLAAMSYMLPHLHNGWQVDQAILGEEERVVVVRFGHDWDPTCMRMDEILHKVSEKVKNFAAVYLVDISEVSDFNKMYELYDPCTVMFFYRNKHIMIDLGTGNNNKINWAIDNGQEMIDVIETVYRGASKGRGLVVSPKDYSTKYRY